MWLGTSAYDIHIPVQQPPGTCSFQPDSDAVNPTRHPKYPNGLHVDDSHACCAACVAVRGCVAWTFATTSNNEQNENCWPFSSVEGSHNATHRAFGMTGSTSLAQVTVTSPTGRVLWNGTNTGNAAQVLPNMLHWPSPGESTGYAFEDSPRFYVPPWGPTPIPAGQKVPPETAATNGYDFTNDISGDTYIFLLGNETSDYWESRGDFLTLTGPTPLLPDFAYGIWYTW